MHSPSADNVLIYCVIGAHRAACISQFNMRRRRFLHDMAEINALQMNPITDGAYRAACMISSTTNARQSSATGARGALRPSEHTLTGNIFMNAHNSCIIFRGRVVRNYASQLAYIYIYICSTHTLVMQSSGILSACVYYVCARAQTRPGFIVCQRRHKHSMNEHTNTHTRTACEPPPTTHCATSAEYLAVHLLCMRTCVRFLGGGRKTRAKTTRHSRQVCERAPLASKFHISYTSRSCWRTHVPAPSRRVIGLGLILSSVKRTCRYHITALSAVCRSE